MGGRGRRADKGDGGGAAAPFRPRTCSDRGPLAAARTSGPVGRQRLKRTSGAALNARTYRFLLAGAAPEGLLSRAGPRVKHSRPRPGPRCDSVSAAVQAVQWSRHGPGRPSPPSGSVLALRPASRRGDDALRSAGGPGDQAAVLGSGEGRTAQRPRAPARSRLVRFSEATHAQGVGPRAGRGRRQLRPVPAGLPAIIRAPSELPGPRGNLAGAWCSVRGGVGPAAASGNAIAPPACPLAGAAAPRLAPGWGVSEGLPSRLVTVLRYRRL